MRKSSSRVPKSNVLDNMKKFFMDTENVVIVVLLSGSSCISCLL